AVGQHRGARLDGQRDARGPRRAGLELPDAAQPGAVVLAAPPGLDDPPRRLDLDEGDVGPVEALQRRQEAEARARPAAGGLHAGHAPVGEVVVAELRVVGDVDEVGEDLLARTADRDRDGDRVHGRPDYAARASLRTV